MKTKVTTVTRIPAVAGPIHATTMSVDKENSNRNAATRFDVLPGQHQRIFKSASEEEMERIFEGSRVFPAVRCSLPSHGYRIEQAFRGTLQQSVPSCFGVNTPPQHQGSSELLFASERSAFRPVIRNPPLPPKSCKAKEMQRHYTQNEFASTSALIDASGRPIPPPRKSLLNKNTRPIPPPRKRLPDQMSVSLYAPNVSYLSPAQDLHTHNDLLSSVATSTPNLTRVNSSQFISGSTVLNIKPISLYPPVEGSQLQNGPQRFRIPVRPDRLTVAVNEPKSALNLLTKKLSTPIGPVERTNKINRSQSSVMPASVPTIAPTNYQSTRMSGTPSSSAVSTMSEMQQSPLVSQNKSVMPSPAASKDSGAHDCSNIDSEFEELDVRKVDKEFEERIKRWNMCSLTRMRESPILSTFRTPKPVTVPRPPKRETSKPPQSHENETKTHDFPEPDFKSSDEPKDDSDAASKYSVESHFTSITHIMKDDKDSDNNIKDGAESDAVTAEAKPLRTSKPLSTFEKNARIVQWIHGIALASTVC